MTVAPAGKHHAGGRWLAFRNDSGETIPAFAAMRITGVVTIEGRSVIKVDKPNDDNLTNLLFNSPVNVPSGGYGSGTHEFPCYAKYQTASSAVLDEEWGTESGSWALKKDNAGYLIIGGETADRVIVRRAVDGPFELLGKTDASHAKGASGTVSIYSGTPGSETDTTIDLTAFNKFANIDSGKWVWVSLYGGNFYITAAEC